MQLFFNRRQVSDIDDLVKCYGTKELASPTRSTVPLLSLLKHGGRLWTDILRELGMTDAVEAHAEFTISTRGGRGKASHTDLMLIEAGRANALEAKWTEPRYQTVEEWLSDASDPENRRAVLAGWLSCLQGHVPRVIKPGEVGGVVYQLLHRLAAACSCGASPGVTYLQFSPLPGGARAEGDHLRSDLEQLRKALKHSPSLEIRLIHLEVEASPAFDQIRELPRGSAGTSEKVRIALRDGALFRFKGYRVEVVGAARAGGSS